MSDERDRLEQAKATAQKAAAARVKELEAKHESAGAALYAGLCRAAIERILAGPEKWVDQPHDIMLRLESYIRRAEALEAAEAENAALRAEVERLKATVLKQDEALRRGHDRDVIVTRERDESRARAARLEMALRGQATRLLPDGGVCYCDIQRSDECRNEPPCVEARAALASGESREGETCWLIEAPAGAWGWQSVHWWCGQQEGGAEWTADATIAVRFLRREDAEAVLNFLTDQLIEVGGGVRVTEHVFLRRALASGESRGPCSACGDGDTDQKFHTHASAGPAEEER